MIGDTVSHYRITAKVGGGAMGVVYRAEDLRLGRDVALKFLPPERTNDEEARDRFRIEARAASALDHPNICTIHDVDATDDGRLFIVMAYYDGESLKARLERARLEGPAQPGRLPVAEALEIGAAVASGLESAHEHGIVHRDLKPANLLLTGRGIPKIVDFGVAKLLGEEGLTRTGVSIGTVAYMSPEQIDGEGIGTAADVWGLGVVLYEMLTGELPFRGTTREIVAAVVARQPEAPGLRRGDVPPEVDALVLEMLAKDPDRRPSAAEVARRLDALAHPAASPGAPLLRRPSTWIAAVAALVVLGFAIALPARQRARVDAARASLVEIERLAAEERFEEAFALAVEAEKVLGDDPAIADLMEEVSEVLRVRSEPPGATVTARLFRPEVVARGELPDPVAVGVTPLDELRLARGDRLLSIDAPGYASVERIVSSRFIRSQRVWNLDARLVVDVVLRTVDAVPEGMVPIPAGRHTLLSADAPAGAVADLDAFFIDRFEVTNAKYLEFVRAGGYDAPELAGLRDRTGLPAPRDWTGQRFAEGADRLPVTGVTWAEAAAYCAWRGGALPTVFEWEKAARDTAVARQEGFVLPWGITRAGESTDLRANFSGAGPVAVDAHPFGISPFGAYAMAGNVREWTASPAGEGYVAMGGSWQDPAYVFTSIATPDPTSASPGLGFRCVRRDPDSGDQGAGRIDLARRTPNYIPVDEATYRGYLDFYRYDPVPPEAEILETVETDDWTRLKIAYDGPDGSRVLAYLYLPRSAAPPYQTMAFVPGLTAFFAGALSESVEWLVGPNIRAGRAVFAPVLSGMVERPFPPGTSIPNSNTVEFRNLMVLHATELRLGLDYLESRDDIDMDRLAYVGQSFGAGSRSVFAAVDDRWKAVVFVGAGIDERLQPTVPEALNVNFLPYVDGPKLVVNGRLDEEHPWATRGLPFWELLREPKDLVLDDDEGHIPSLEVRVPAINDFLDEQFGPVR